MRILVLNCGGSSLKYKLYDFPDEAVLCHGHVDRLGTPHSVSTHCCDAGEWRREKPVPDHESGIRMALESITAAETGVVSELSGIDAVAHKLAHGGSAFSGAVAIDDEVVAEMERLVPLAPLHNPPNLKGIAVCRKLLPHAPQFGTFETSFHATVPPAAYVFGLPYDWLERFGVRRYGFHSCSHRYVNQRVAELMLGSRDELRHVSCHLGSGTSVCAIACGESVDISSALTPQAGTIMSTRPGDFDAQVLTYMMRQTGMSVDEVDTVLVRDSGLLGISGVSGDLRDIHQAAERGNERAVLALEVFAYQIVRYVGAYHVAVGGMDVLTFTGGIGEKDADLRSRVCARLECIGVAIDPSLNESAAGEARISTQESAVAVWVVPTDEELVVARDAWRLAGAG